VRQIVADGADGKVAVSVMVSVTRPPQAV